MKSLLKTTAFRLLTLGSFAVTVATPAQALPSSFQKSITSQIQGTLKAELIAYSTYCETRIFNVPVIGCCADSFGNWSCTH